MAFFGSVLSGSLAVMQIPFTIYGFTLSWWQVFLWTACAFIALWVVFSLWR